MCMEKKPICLCIFLGESESNQFLEGDIVEKNFLKWGLNCTEARFDFG